MNAANLRTYLLFSGNGTINVGGTISGGGITSTAGGGTGAPTAGTVNYNNSGNQNVGAYTYYNLTVSGNGTKTLAGAIAVNRNLAIQGTATLASDIYQITGNATGTLTMNAGTSLTLGRNGDATAVGFPTNYTNANTTLNSTSSVVYQTNGVQNVSATPVYGNLTITGTGTKTLLNAITVNGNLLITGTANLYSDTYQITGNAAKTFTMDSGTTLTLGNTTNSTNVLFPSNYTAVNISLDPTSTVVYQAGGAQTVSAVPQYGNLTIATNGTTKTCNGSLKVNGNLAINGTTTLSAGTTASTWNIAGNVTIDGTLNFGTTAVKTINITGTLIDNTGTITMTGTGLAHMLNLYGSSNSISTLNTTAGSNSSISYLAAGDQQIISSPNYQNLVIDGGGVKTAIGNNTVNGKLTLNNGLLRIGNFNINVQNNSSTAIQGTFGSSTYIDINGTGYVQQAVAATTSYTVPIGSNGTYAPVTVQSISSSTYLRLRTVYSTSLGSQYLKRYWQLTGSAATTATITFGYDPTENPKDPTKIWYRNGGAWSQPTGTQSFDGINRKFTITGTTNISAATTEWTAGYPPKTFFSYQSGSWNDASTWTSDPGGTTYENIGTPTDSCVVVILPDRTVTLPSNVANVQLEVNINEGGILDMATYSFSSELKELDGGGTLKLASVNFPTATTNTFVNAGGGTTEYYNSANFTLPAAQTTYNHLRINAPGVTATQLSNITLNGNLHVKQGTYRINDNSANRRQLIIHGDVTVDAGASITVGAGVTNTITDPTTAAESGTPPYISYYDAHSHRVVIYGNLTNNGTVRFTNLSYPVYNAFPPTTLGTTTGFATVYFMGASSNDLYCNGTTDFYNLVLDKGVDQTYSLTVYSTAYANFRLFGANNAGGYGGGANPNLCKALWIRNGTMVLQGSTIIPSLSEGTVCASTPNSDFYVPANGALVLDGDNVVVLTTADDYREVNVAYGVSAPSNAAMGVNAGAGCSSFSILGLLRVNKGYISTRESGGFIQWNVSSGQFEINGGRVDAKQYRTAGTAGGLASYTQTGGLFELRGRFRRVPSAYSSVSDLVNAPISTSRLNGGLQPLVGTLNLNESANVFNMSGGTIRIFDVCGDGTAANQQKAVEILSSKNNINVTGGTLEVMPTTGTVLANSPIFSITSNAEFGNFTVNRQSSSAVVTLVTGYPLTVLANYSLLSGEFNANSQNVTIGGNMFVANGTTYTSGTNWTTFNGSANQTITANTASALVFKKFRMDKPAGKILNLAGTQTDFQVADSLMLVSGTLNDGGKTLSLVTSATSSTSYVFNSALHLGTGKIAIADDDPTVVDGSGSGIFKNLELNNSDALAAPVSLRANTTISGVLTFARDKLLDISTYNLKLTSTASISGYSSSRYIKTAGNAGDGGVTRTYSAGSATFVYPVGINGYTPSTLTVNGTPTAWGDITVYPVEGEHPATTVKNRSLSYFWRVKSSGFTLGSSATLTHRYDYLQADVVTGSDVTEDGYVAARFNTATSTWTSGAANDVDETNNIIGEPGSGSFLEGVAFIDGDYTAGDNNPTNPFGTPTTYYSRQTGLWGNVNSWSTTGHSGSPATAVPGAGDIVIIGNGNTITSDQNRSCAILKIETGSTLDIYTYTGGNFGMVLNHPNGNGLFRVTTPKAPSYAVPKFFTFPTGDFTEFNANDGTTEYYDIDGTVGALYILPSNVTSYGNLVLRAKGGDNLVLPNNSSTTIHGNLTCTGDATTAWVAMCWNTNIWPYWTNDYNPTLEKTVYVHGNLNVDAGTLIFFNDQQPQHLIVDGDVTVNNGAVLRIYSAYPFSTPVITNNTIKIGGSLINNGTVSLREQNGGNYYYVNTTFYNASTNYIKNTSGTPLTIFNNLTIDKGSSQADSLIIDISNTLTTPTDSWLTLKNGTLVYRRSNPATDFTISAATPFTIPETAGLYIDYPNNSNNRNILIANAANSASDLMLDGKLTVKAGNVYVGPTNGTTNNNNDIVYSGDGLSTLDIQGGNLRVNGQIRRSTATTTGVLKYYQSGGNVVINGQGGDATALTRAKLEVVNTGSVFSMSDGTITIVRGSGTSYGDLYLRPASGSVTGGEIIFTQSPSGWAGAVVDALQTYRMDASIPLNSLTVTGKTAATARSATVTLMVNPLVLNGSLTISNNQSYFDANSSNNLNVSLKGNFTNNGTYRPQLNTTTFNGGTQSILGASTTSFYNLVANPVTSLTMGSSSINVDGNLTLSSGQLLCGSYSVNLKGNFTNNADYTDNGTGVRLVGATQQNISGSGTFSTLELNNVSGARLLSSITLNKDLKLTQGIFNINQYKLTLGVNSNITGTSFSATKMIEVDGAFSNVGILKYFPIYNGADVTFTYPLGVSSKYTPAVFTYSKNDVVGYIRVNAINSYHPGVLDRNRVLQYYWEVENSAVSGVNGKMELYYKDADVRGSEPDYVAARTIGSTSWSKAAPGPTTDNVDEGTNKITFTYSGANDLNGEYTAGEDTAFPNNIPQFTSQKDGDWNDKTVWVQTGGDPYTLTGAPNGFIVTISAADNVTLNENSAFTYRMQINGTLKAVQPHYGHNLGTVSGSGTLYLDKGTMPAGRYTQFLSCATGGTLEYGGSSDYNINADLYSSVPKIHFTGTGNRVLPSKDLTICHQLLINGPTLDNSVNNRKLTIQGTMERPSGTFTAGTGANAIVEFAGSSAQTLGGATGNFTGLNKFNHFTINNSSNLSIGTNGQVEIGGNLNLTSGRIITTSTNKLSIVNTAINCVNPAGGSASSYVDGPLTKKVNSGDGFKFPVGKGSTVGNKITLLSSQSGTIDWTVEFFTPNSTFGSYAAPLTYVNSKEYWTVSAASGSQAKVGLDWDPASDLTPLMTESGLSDMRVAYDNGGTWTELASSASGDGSNGTVSTSSRYTIPASGTEEFTIACINTIKPRARFSPSGPVCGTSGIPVTFIGASIPFNYILSYKKDEVAQTPVTITSVPYTLPTSATGATYVLTGFSYNNPSSPTNGVVDPTPVTTYTVPTTANAGPDQSICGGTSATLAANTPTVGTGLWSILAGAGGTVVTPTVPTSTFNGTNGTSYTLRWTISNGGCTSSDDVGIAFPLLPEQPAAFIHFDDSVCQGDLNVAYSVANNPTLTYNWGYSGSGATMVGSGNEISIDYSGTATSGDISVFTTNGCGDSAPLSRAVTVNGRPTASIAVVGGYNPICDGDNTQMTITLSGGTSPYSFSITDGSHTDNITGATSLPYTYSPTTFPIWTGPGSNNTYTYSIPTVTSANGCTNSGSNSVDVTVYKVPETGPEYHIPNNMGF